MAKSDTIYVLPNTEAPVKPIRLIKGEIRLLSVDFNPYLGNKSTTLTDARFTNENDTICIAAPTISGGVASAEVEACDEGNATLKAVGTLASGEQVIRKFYVFVTDPEAGSGLLDYAA